MITPSTKDKSFDVLSRSLEANVDPLILFQACTDSVDKTSAQHRILLESSEPGVQGSQHSMLLISQALKIEARGQKVTVEAVNANGKIALNKIKLCLEQQTNHTPDVEPSILENKTNLVLMYPDTRLIEEESKRVKRLTSLDAIRKIQSILTHNNQADAHKLIIAGIVGFDYVDSLEVLPLIESTTDDFPDFLFFVSDQQIIMDQKANRIEIREILFNDGADEFRLGQARGRIHDREQLIKEQHKISTNEESSLIPVQQNHYNVSPQAEEFLQQVALVKDAIEKGQIFQTVISRQFSMPCNHPMLAYQILKQQNPSPYQFYLEMGDDIVIGASPESSLCYKHQNRSIAIMPIAGTRGRGRTASGKVNEELDARLEADLKLDKKELAEHLMLVDLARNDIARVAETGSRKVKELMSVVRYSAVMHMVSCVEATLHSELDVIHACQSCFHMGTLTGAPKKEAMTIIRNIEQRKRGVYGGAVGYFTGDGDLDTAIVIRSAHIKNGTAVITAGAGIVADSVAEAELKETELKAASVINAISLSEQLSGENDKQRIEEIE